MCFSARCELQKSDGECSVSNFPEGWICPPDQGVCSCCGDIGYSMDMEDGECENCQAARREVEVLKVEIERVMVKLDALQEKYRGYTGQNFIKPLRWGRTA